MKRILLFVVMLMLLLCACSPADTDDTTGQTNDTTQWETQETTTENTDNTDNTENNPATDSNMSVDMWQVETPVYLSYEEYFSVPREISRSTVQWIKGDKRFCVRNKDNAWYVCCQETEAYYKIPNVENDESGEIYVAGADGRYAYFSRYEYTQNTYRLFRVELATGETEALLEGLTLSSYNLQDNLLLYYTACTDGKLTVGRIYLPTMQQDVLYEMQGDFYKIALENITNTAGPLSWTMINPDMIDLLKAELADPDSQYRKIPVNGGTGEYDYSQYWEDENGLSRILMESFLLHHIQDTSGVRAFLKCTYNPADGSLTRKTGIIDSCWHGSGYPHDHFNPEVTTGPEPEVIMGQWQDLGEIPSFITQSDDTVEADCILLTGVDSGKYVYVKTHGDYQRLSDTPVSWMQDTGSCVLYMLSDKKTLYAATYDGSQSATLYEAARGEIYVNSSCLDEDRLVILDGDTLVEIDLTNGRGRELLRHPNLQYYYIDTGEDSVYFEAYVGLYVYGSTINLITGELRGGYRL